MHSEAEAEVEPTEASLDNLAGLEHEAATQVMQKLLDYIAGKAPELDVVTYRVSADEYDDYL